MPNEDLPSQSVDAEVDANLGPIERFDSLMEEVGQLQNTDKKRRFEKYYGTSGLQKFSNWFNNADIRNIHSNQSLVDEIKQRGLKILKKGGIAGGVGIIAAGILGGSVAILPAAIGVGAGLAVRTAWEAGRMAWSGERQVRNEIELANEAVIQKIEQMSGELAELQFNIIAEDPLLTPEQIEQDPRYKSLMLEITEMICDDTLRRAKKIVNLQTGKVTYEGLRKDEGVDEGGNSGVDVINVGEKEKGLIKRERNLELGADLLSATATIGASVLGGLHAAKEIGQAAATTAHQTGQQAAQNAGEVLKHGQTVGKYDFDGLAIPDSAKDHLVQVIQHGVKPYFDQTTHIWHDSLANLQAAIGKIKKKSELVKQTALASTKIFEMTKGLIGLNVVNLVNFFAGRVGHKDIESAEKIDKAKVNRAGELINGPVIGETGGGETLNVELPAEEEEQDEHRFSINQALNIPKDQKIRDKIGLGSPLFRNFENFCLAKYKTFGGEEYAELRPIQKVDGQWKLVADSGIAEILTKNLADTNNIVKIGLVRFETVDGKINDENTDDTFVEVEEVAPEPEPKPEVREITDEDKEFLEKLAERNKNLPPEKKHNYQSAAAWVFSRLSAEQRKELHAHGEDDKYESEKQFNELAREVLKDQFVVHYADKKGKYPDLDGKGAIGLLELAAIVKNDDAVIKIPAGSEVIGKINIDTGNVNGVATYGGSGRDDKGYLNYDWENDPMTGFIDHHGPKVDRKESATSQAYDVLVGLGMIDEEKYPYLKNLVNFVTVCDNHLFPNTEDDFRKSDKTLYGLSRFMNFKNLETFFKDGRDPSEKLTDADLEKYGLKYTDYRTRKPVDKSADRKKSIDESIKNIDELKDAGWTLESKNFGKILIDNGAKVPSRAEAASALGFDTYLLWNTKTKSFFISSKNAFPEGFSLSQGVSARENMWIKPESNLDKLTISLKDILEKMGASAEEITRITNLEKGIKKSQVEKPPKPEIEINDDEQLAKIKEALRQGKTWIIRNPSEASVVMAEANPNQTELGEFKSYVLPNDAGVIIDSINPEKRSVRISVKLRGEETRKVYQLGAAEFLALAEPDYVRDVGPESQAKINEIKLKWAEELAEEKSPEDENPEFLTLQTKLGPVKIGPEVLISRQFATQGGKLTNKVLFAEKDEETGNIGIMLEGGETINMPEEKFIEGIEEEYFKLG
ncbi:MAG: hypothetical protein NTY30_04940 [Candidatus Berkelbacteria bacterium]|nr:hypothetical protein [Candidatus Berkelbacteria bacterium]